MTDQLYPAFGPVHRLGLGIVRDWFAGVKDEGRPVTIGSRIPSDLSEKMPFVMVRADRRSGMESAASRDERFLKATKISVETFTTGLNAENDGYDIQESIRLAFWQAWREQKVVDDAGSISQIVASTEAALVSDYATSTGVVQYASLPKGAARTEAIYQVLVRPPAQATLTNHFIPQIARS